MLIAVEASAQDPNSAPTFTSDAARSVAENTAVSTAVLTVTATDSDSQDTEITYALTGGADQADFTLGETSGELKFAAAPDYERPADEDANNAYVVEVTATSGADTRALSATQTITVTVTDVDSEKPGQPAKPTVSPVPTAPTKLTVSWTEPTNTGPDITDYNVQYRAGSSGNFTDASYSGTARTTTLTSLTASTEYEVQVQATNAEGTGDWSLSGTGTTAASNAAPTITSDATASVAENTAVTTAVLTVAATDSDSQDTQITYARTGGADQADFTLGESSGELKFAAVPNYEAPADENGDNVYVLEVTATSGTDARALTAMQTITITVTDIAAPAAPAKPTVAAASRTSLTVSWTAPANTGKPPITGYDVEYRTPSETGTWQGWSHSGTATVATLTGLEMGTEYGVQVRASSSEGDGAWSTEGTGSTTANQAPSFGASSISLTVAENTVASTEFGTAVTATDPENDSLTYTLGGTDMSSFAIGTGSGKLATRAALDHEDTSSYEVTVTADDGNGGSAEIDVTIAVSDVDEPPAAPAAPTVASVSATELTVTWTAPSNTGKPAITNYDLQYGARSGSTTVKSDVGIDLTESLTSLTAGTLYDVQVRAKNDEGTGGWSNAGAGRTAPPKVTGVTATAAVDALSLSWSAAQGATGYKVQWKSGAEAFATSRQRTTTGTSDTIPDLTAGVTYSVQVIATHGDTPDGVPSSAATGTPLAGVSIGPPAAPVTEGDPAVFTLTRSSGNLVLPVTVSVTRTATFLETHTATNPSTLTVSIAASASTAALTLATHADEWDEDDGRFEATVTAGTGYRPTGSVTASVTVQDNDPPPELSLADQTVTEGAGTNQVCASMTPPSHKTVQVPLSTADGSAVSAADKDYTALSTTLTIAPGSAANAPNTQACAALTVTDDPLLEDPETLTATLGSPLNATVSTTSRSATVTIADNETAAAVDLADATLSVAEDTDSALDLCATLAPLAGKPIAVRVTSADGSAEAGRDFAALASDATLNFPVETARACLPLTVIDNTADDGDRDFTVSLAATTGLDSRVTLGATTGSTTVTIQDEDVVPGAPRSLTADPWSSEVLLGWSAGDAGSDPITGYEYRYRRSGDTDFGASTATNRTSLMVSGLANATEYTFQVRAVNEVGAGAWAEESATPRFALTRVTAEAPHSTVENDPTSGALATFLLHRTGATTRPLTVWVRVSRFEGDQERGANNEAATFAIGASTVEHQVAVIGVGWRVVLEVPAPTTSDDQFVVGDPRRAHIDSVADASGLPGAPGSLTAARGGGQVTLSWTAGTSGTSDITGHRYRQKTRGAFGEWEDIPNSAPTEASATSYTVTGLTNGVEYTFQVQAVNATGAGPASNEASATPTGADLTPPTLVGATVDGAAVTLTYNEPLDEDSTPSASAFTATAGSSTLTVSAVSVTGRAVALAIAPAARAGDTVELSYTVPTGNGAAPIQDLAGNDAAALTRRTLTNDSPGVPDAPTELTAERGNAQVTLSWTPSASDGGSPVLEHEYQQKEGVAGSYGGWTDIRDSAPDGANGASFTVTGLTNETQHFFQVRAVNRIGESTASNEADATPTDADIVAPELERARVEGGSVVLTYNEPLNAAPPPDASLFTVTVGGATASVSEASVAGAAVTLALTPAAVPGQVVTLSYSPTLGGPPLVRDLADNPAGSLGSFPVPNLPGAPQALAAVAGSGQVTLSWQTRGDGGSAVTGHQYQRKSGRAGTWPGTWSDIRDSGAGGTNYTSYTVTGVSDVPQAFFRVRAVNEAGAGPASDEVNAPPELASAQVVGATLTLTYNEPLDAASTPAAAAFAVTVSGGASPGVSGVQVSGATLTLTLAPPAAAGVSVTVSYTPGSSPLRDTAGIDAAALAGRTVANLPGAPQHQEPAPGNGEVRLNWAPGGDGGSAVTGHQYRQREGAEDYAEDWTDVPDSAPGGANERSHTVGALINRTEYFFQIRAVNAVGEGPPSDEQSAIPEPEDQTAPALLSAEVSGETLTLTYNEALDETAPPPATAFVVSGDGVSRSVSAVQVSGATVTLTITPPAARGTVLTLDYTAPEEAGATPVQDLAGNRAESLSGQEVTVATSALPAAPTGLTASAGAGVVTLRWNPAADDGGSAITGYQWRRREAAEASYAEEWTQIPDSAVGGANERSHAVTGLSAGSEHFFQVRAVTEVGASAPSNEASATLEAVDTTPPVLLEGAVDATTLTLTYGEPLDAASTPSAAAYAVTEEGVPRGVTAVLVAGDQVTLTLAPAVRAGTAVSVSYAPGRNPIRDAAGNEAAALSGREVANTTPASAPEAPGRVTGLRVSPRVEALQVSWNAVDEADGYRVQWKSGAEAYGAGGRQHTISDGATTSYRIGGLNPGTAYTVRVLATRRGAPDGPPSAERTATPRASDVNERGNRITEVLLPEVARAHWGHTVAAVSERIAAPRHLRDAETGAQATASLSGRESLPAALQAYAATLLHGDSFALGDVLPGSAFSFPLGTAVSAEAAGDGPGPGVALWGRAAYRSLAGEQGAVAWHGEVPGVHLGADLRVGDLLAGLAVAWSQSELAYEDTGGGALEEGGYESWLLGVNPYLGLSIGSIDLWSVFGLGWGEATVSDSREEPRSRELWQWSAAAGASGTLRSDGRSSGAASSVKLKTEGAYTWAELAPAAHVDRSTADLGWVRLALEGRYDISLGGRRSLVPVLEAGVRHDLSLDREAASRTGIEVGAGVSYRDGGLGFTLAGNARARFDLASDEFQEWGAGGLLQWNSDHSGRGLSVSVRPAWGVPASGVDRLYEVGAVGTAGRATPASAPGRLEAGLGYGVATLGGQGLLTPYGRLTLAATGARVYHLGGRLEIHPGRAALSLEGARHDSPGLPPWYRATLTGSLQF